MNPSITPYSRSQARPFSWQQCAWLLLFSAPLTLSHAQGAAPVTGLSVSVPLVASPLPTASGQVLVYELNVRNHDENNCARLTDVRAQGGRGQSFLDVHYQGDALAANTLAYTREMARATEPPAQPMPPGATSAVTLPAGGGGVIYFFVPLGAGKPAPTSLKHTLQFVPCAGAADIQRVVYDLAIVRQAPLVIGLPSSGNGWVAGDSVTAKGVHRRTLIPVRDAAGKPLTGQFHVPERYAIDWVMVDENARRARGPVQHNASYLAFGKSIIAVADGTIARTRDGMPEQTPPKSPPNPSIDTAAGNYIMQAIGGGRFAFYAHLQPGSLRVKPGQQVKRGQVLAVLGNTGNSTEPHLHFHVSNTDDPLMSEGVPFVFDHMEEIGQVDGMNEATGMFDDYLQYAPIVRSARMPGSFSVLNTGTDAPSITRPARRGSLP